MRKIATYFTVFVLISLSLIFTNKIDHVSADIPAIPTTETVCNQVTDNMNQVCVNAEWQASCGLVHAVAWYTATANDLPNVGAAGTSFTNVPLNGMKIMAATAATGIQSGKLAQLTDNIFYFPYPPSSWSNTPTSLSLGDDSGISCRWANGVGTLHLSYYTNNYSVTQFACSGGTDVRWKCY
jgi:hypothetical protein